MEAEIIDLRFNTIIISSGGEQYLLFPYITKRVMLLSQENHPSFKHLFCFRKYKR